MYNHEPPGYQCPFCRIVSAACGSEDHPETDVIYSSEKATAFLALRRWKNNPLDVLVVPNEHFENLYDLSQAYVAPLHLLTRAVGLALKEVFQCDGISTRQHNEPSGSQDVWHYHVHVIPRYDQDDFYHSHAIPFPETERLEAARRLREYIQAHQEELFRVS